MGEVRAVEEWVLERGLGGHYDGRYRVNDHSVGGLLCMWLCWGLNREVGGGRCSFYKVEVWVPKSMRRATSVC